MAVALGTGSVADNWGCGAGGGFNNPQEPVIKMIMIDKRVNILFIILHRKNTSNYID
jgi:hypothetical protein